MNTTRGEMNEDDVTKEVTMEEVPCGTCITTTYYAKDNGEVVRVDQTIRVDYKKIPGLTSSTNLAASLEPRPDSW